MARCFLLSLHQGYNIFFSMQNEPPGSLLHSVHCNEKTAAVSGFAGQSVYFSFFFFFSFFVVVVVELM